MASHAHAYLRHFWMVRGHHQHHDVWAHFVHLGAGPMSRVPFALRWLQALLPGLQGQTEASVDLLAQLLDRCSGEPPQDACNSRNRPYAGPDIDTESLEMLSSALHAAAPPARLALTGRPMGHLVSCRL